MTVIGRHDWIRIAVVGVDVSGIAAVRIAPSTRSSTANNPCVEPAAKY